MNQSIYQPFDCIYLFILKVLDSLVTSSMIPTKYILPLFGLLSEKGGDYIKIIDIYTM